MDWPPPGKDLPLNSPASPGGRLGEPHSMRFPPRVSQSRGLEIGTKLPCSLGHLWFKSQGSAGTWPPPYRQTSTAPPKLPKRARLGGLCQVAAEGRERWKMSNRPIFSKPLENQSEKRYHKKRPHPRVESIDGSAFLGFPGIRSAACRTASPTWCAANQSESRVG